jgi:Tfp pilus assembly protein PilV
VPIAQQCDQHAIDQVRLSHDQAARVRFELLEFFYQAHVSITPTGKTACHSIDEVSTVQQKVPGGALGGSAESLVLARHAARRLED